VERDQLAELQYIAPSSNLPSILSQGLMSHVRAARLSPRSIADPAVQARRARKVVPQSGRRLHEYVNLYFNARNPMLYTRMALHDKLCVLRIAPEVLDTPGAVIADCNASSDYVAFWPSPDGLSRIVYEHTFAEWWRRPDLDQIEQWRLKSATQAELLVPDVVPADLILGGYVAGKTALNACRVLGCDTALTVDRFLFFKEPR
jgi:hypothetical protein